MLFNMNICAVNSGLNVTKWHFSNNIYTHNNLTLDKKCECWRLKCVKPKLHRGSLRHVADVAMF